MLTASLRYRWPLLLGKASGAVSADRIPALPLRVFVWAGMLAVGYFLFCFSVNMGVFIDDTESDEAQCVQGCRVFCDLRQ